METSSESISGLGDEEKDRVTKMDEDDGSSESIKQQAHNQEEVHSQSKDETTSTSTTAASTTATSVSLPLARVKRIIKQDDDIVHIAPGAVFAVAAAAELFSQYFAEKALLSARGNRHKKILYSDFSAAVSQYGELEFLSSLVPQTVTFKSIKDKNPMTAPPGKSSSKSLGKGQTTLSGLTKGSPGGSGKSSKNKKALATATGVSASPSTEPLNLNNNNSFDSSIELEEDNDVSMADVSRADSSVEPNLPEDTHNEISD